LQSRFGLCFFILFYLALLSMSSLPVWRDEHALHAHERAAGAYGDAAYFGAVVVCDVLLVRALPPLACVCAALASRTARPPVRVSVTHRRGEEREHISPYEDHARRLSTS
jgi:hypothetical protein